MKQWRKVFAVITMALILGGTSTAYAANDFTFAFVNCVVGKTVFSLKNKTTKCQTRAETFRYNTNSYVTPFGNYAVSIVRKSFFNSSYDGDYKKADGYCYTTKFGKIKKGKYTVTVGSNSHLAAGGREIRGGGTLKQ